MIDFANAMGYNSTWSTPRNVNLVWNTSTDPCEQGQYWSSIPNQDPFFYCDPTNTTLVRIYMNNVKLSVFQSVRSQSKGIIDQHDRCYSRFVWSGDEQCHSLELGFQQTYSRSIAKYDWQHDKVTAALFRFVGDYWMYPHKLGKSC